MLLNCWRRLLKVPWTTRRSNQSILNEISPELEGLMLKLKLQYFVHLMRRTDSLKKTLMLGKMEGRRRRGRQRIRWLAGIINFMDMSLSKLRELVMDREVLSCCSPWGVTKSQTQLSNWTTSCKMLAGWITSWNQDCWEKYQQTQIWRWYHSNGRKWKGTKEPLDEGERIKWESWLETQYSKN